MHAIHLDDRISGALIEESLHSAPRYERFAPAAKHAIRVLHGTPELFTDLTLDQMEIYIGRTASRHGHVAGRFHAHRRQKRHRYGVVLFRCATSHVKGWEKAANRLVKQLAAQRALCVANAVAGGQGLLPSSPESCIYLTWKRRRRRTCRPISPRDLDRLAREVHRGDLDVSLDSVRRGIRAVAFPAESAFVRWGIDRSRGS